jgi:hypothetical protein
MLDLSWSVFQFCLTVFCLLFFLIWPFLPAFLVYRRRRMMSDYKVEMVNDGMQEFFVEFKGPAESNSPRAESRLLFSLPASRADGARS